MSKKISLVSARPQIIKAYAISMKIKKYFQKVEKKFKTTELKT